MIESPPLIVLSLLLHVSVNVNARCMHESICHVLSPVELCYSHLRDDKIGITLQQGISVKDLYII